MLQLIRNLHNRRPLLWSVIAFIIAVVTVTTMSIWWNVLLVQNHRILREMTKAATAAANNPDQANFPLAALMVLGILLSLVIVVGLIYMFLRLIRTVQLNLAQSQFIAAVTHELRSPVASLQILLDTIRDSTTPHAKRIEFEERMDVDLKRLRGLVDQVLETARLENFLLMPNQDELEVSALLDACREHVSSRLTTTGSRLKIGTVSDGLKIRGNRALLLTALTNVLDNAMKYSSGPADIDIEIQTGAKLVRIDVTDNGIGLGRQEAKRIFKRFYRAKDPLARSKAGTGLGLYFARLALRAQGGSISAISAGPGMGTTFRLELPKA